MSPSVAPLCVSLSYVVCHAIAHYRVSNGIRARSVFRPTQCLCRGHCYLPRESGQAPRLCEIGSVVELLFNRYRPTVVRFVCLFVAQLLNSPHTCCCQGSLRFSQGGNSLRRRLIHWFDRPLSIPIRSPRRMQHCRACHRQATYPPFDRCCAESTTFEAATGMSAWRSLGSFANRCVSTG